GRFGVRRRCQLVRRGWFSSGRGPAPLGPGAAGVWAGRRLEVVSRHYDSGEEAKRVLDPLGLVLKAGVWYLVASRDGESRTYRISRIRSARVLNEESSRPPDFDLPAYWADSVSRFEVGAPRLAVTLSATSRAIAALHKHGCEPEPVERPGRGRVRTT